MSCACCDPVCQRCCTFGPKFDFEAFSPPPTVHKYVEVDTTKGRVRGFASEPGGVVQFRGVPYAQAPRFAPAGPCERWTDTKDCTRWGPAFFQHSAAPEARILFEGLPNIIAEYLCGCFMRLPDPKTHGRVVGEFSENAFNVNIWTPEVPSEAAAAPSPLSPPRSPLPPLKPVPGKARPVGAVPQGRPVLVFVHGGAFVSGGNNWLHMYNGQWLAQRGGGLVVVTVNYRLGVLAYSTQFAEQRAEAAPGGPVGAGAAANLALRDVIAALRWVQAEIGRFGGDPGCVTLCGQSAGAILVGHLMGSPLAAGLFHRVISQSVCVLGDSPPAEQALKHRLLQQHFAKHLGLRSAAPSPNQVGPEERGRLSDLHRAMRRAAAPALVQGQQRLGLFASPQGSMAHLYNAARDAEVVPLEGTLAGIRDRAQEAPAKIPLLIGWTAQEFDLYALASPFFPKTREDWANKVIVPFLRGKYHTSVEEEAQGLGLEEARAKWREFALELYELCKRGMEARGEAAGEKEIVLAAMSSFFTVFPALEIAEAHSSAGNEVYLYNFEWKGGTKHGAVHGIDLGFLWNAVRSPTHQPYVSGFSGDVGDNPAVGEIADRMMDSWAAFCRHGHPNPSAHPAMPAWPQAGAAMREPRSADGNPEGPEEVSVSPLEMMRLAVGANGRSEVGLVGAEWYAYRALDQKITAWLKSIRSVKKSD